MKPSLMTNVNEQDTELSLGVHMSLNLALYTCIKIVALKGTNLTVTITSSITKTQFLVTNSIKS